MPLLLAAKVWHYWLAFALLGPIVLVTLFYAIGYVVKVVSPKYPKQ